VTSHIMAAAESAQGGDAGRHRRHGRRRTAIVAACSAVAIGVPAVLGHAGWWVSGPGDGDAQARTAQTLIVVAGGASAQLYPGATGDVVFSVYNPNAYDVEIDAASLLGVTGTSDGGCPTSEFTLNVGSVTAVTIDAGQTGPVTVTGGVTMTSTAPDGCQGVTVTVSGTVSGGQA
jgi:hypothetical protein